MPAPIPLPEPLRSGAFDRADLADERVSVSRVRRGDTANPFHGVHILGAASVGVLGRCTDYAVRLRPGQLFTHVTAAQLHGLPLPPKLEARSALDVAAVHPAGPPETRGAVGHRLRRAPETQFVDGLPVSSVGETWCQLADRLDLVELVVIADHVLRTAALAALEAGGDPDEAAGAAADGLRESIAVPGRMRRPILSRALALARWRSASPGESRTRVVLVEAGVAEPELNVPLHASGRFLGIPDMTWRRERVLLEYEGDGHRVSKQQFRQDIDRYERFQSEDWRVVRATADSVRPERRAALVQRVRRLLDGTADREPVRIRVVRGLRARPES